MVLGKSIIVWRAGFMPQQEGVGWRPACTCFKIQQLSPDLFGQPTSLWNAHVHLLQGHLRHRQASLGEAHHGPKRLVRDEDRPARQRLQRGLRQESRWCRITSVQTPWDVATRMNACDALSPHGQYCTCRPHGGNFGSGIGSVKSRAMKADQRGMHAVQQVLVMRLDVSDVCCCVFGNAVHEGFVVLDCAINATRVLGSIPAIVCLQESAALATWKVAPDIAVMVLTL
mmetsp:Transcript_21429/g.44523  ORF Transcript_21429/g.44523 Transcript_21429/m.44523 type:complete len:228 (+) Transcript_21429:187-870(+)